ncbi:MAG: hypothetical protein ABR591_09845 [Candidatus Velthaea sp.]
MTYEGDVRDPRSIARMINLAHRFDCSPVWIDAHAASGVTRVRIAFSGAPQSMTRLMAQIGKVVEDEAVA